MLFHHPSAQDGKSWKNVVSLGDGEAEFNAMRHWGSLGGDALVTSSYLLLVVRPGAPFVASLLLVAMPGARSSFLFITIF